MEREWELDRIRLFQVWRVHRDWTLPRLSKTLNRSLSWVKKWLKRFRETEPPTLEMFKSQSRAPHHRARQLTRIVRDAILDFRDQLKALYGRVVGPKTILFHLHSQPQLLAQGAYLPRSPRTIWQVLREAGRIPIPIREHHPLERPEPMRHWEMDFGQLGSTFEFLSVVDRGTSILVDTQTQPHYNAEIALLAVAQLLMKTGCPQKLRFDNDTRFVGNWLADGYPSPLMRFLVCLGIEPDLVEPGKPYHKPFVERSVRTLKHECLREAHPEDWLDANGILAVYRQFYNHDRPNQSSACGNRPPYTAFPDLPVLPSLPEKVDPDAWLHYYDGHLFKRRVGQNGSISVGNQDYYIGYQYAGQPVGVVLNAEYHVFNILQQGTTLRQLEIKSLMGRTFPFEEYLRLMLADARTIQST